MNIMLGAGGGGGWGGVLGLWFLSVVEVLFFENSAPKIPLSRKR
eukprot:COSAG01_NODE_29730_length_631_cov_0.402256_1_plen_43_part_10